MNKTFIVFLLSTCSLFSSEENNSPFNSSDELIDYLEYQCVQQSYYMDNADSQEWHMFFRGKYLGYKDVKDFIEFRDLRH